MYELVLVVALLWLFWSSLTRANKAAEKVVAAGVTVVDVTADVVGDSTRTWGRRAHILNAEERKSQKESIDKLGEVPSHDELDKLLKL